MAADLTFEVIESALVDDQLEEPDFEPEQVEGFEDPEAFPSVSKMREVVASRVKEGWSESQIKRFSTLLTCFQLVQRSWLR